MLEQVLDDLQILFSNIMVTCGNQRGVITLPAVVGVGARLQQLPDDLRVSRFYGADEGSRSLVVTGIHVPSLLEEPAFGT
jgi:hypothetical protein